MADIFALLPKVAGDIGAVGKGRENKDQKYRFRGIDDFLNAAHGALVKHGVTIIPRVISRELRPGQTKSGTANLWVGLTVEFHFYAPDGSSVSATVASEGLDMSDKATNKAMSAALKYALIQVFSIPTEDMDEADNTSPEQSVPVNSADFDKAQAWGDENCAIIESYSFEHEWERALRARNLKALQGIAAKITRMQKERAQTRVEVQDEYIPM